MWFIGFEVEQEASAPPPKKNPGSAPGKCGNMSSLSLSNNSGSVEMWKCGNMSSLYSSNNPGSKKMWKCGNMSSLS